MNQSDSQPVNEAVNEAVSNPVSEFDSREFVAALPRRPGVYRMYGAEGELLYVGKARSLKDRVGSYFSPGKVEPKTFALVQQIARIEVTVTNSDTEALLRPSSTFTAECRSWE